MNLSRKRMVPLLLAGALLSTPALAATHTPSAHTFGDRPPAIQLATLTQRKRSRRSRGAKVRMIMWWIARRATGAGAIRAARQTVQPRLAPHDFYARGPPRSPSL